MLICHGVKLLISSIMLIIDWLSCQFFLLGSDSILLVFICHCVKLLISSIMLIIDWLSGLFFYLVLIQFFLCSFVIVSSCS